MDRAHSQDELQLLTVRQTASRLGCSAANVYSLIECGDLPIVRVGRHKGYRVDIRDLDGFIYGRKFRYQGPMLKPSQTRLKHLKR